MKSKFWIVLTVAVAVIASWGCAGDDDDDDDDDDSTTAEQSFCDDYDDKDVCEFCWQYGTMIEKWESDINSAEKWAKRCMVGIENPDDDFFECLYETCDFDSIEYRNELMSCERNCM